MTVIDSDPNIAFDPLLNTMPKRLFDSANGGLRLARLFHPVGGTHESFMRSLYGESYEKREWCELVRALVLEVKDQRGERTVDGISYMQPIVAEGDDGELFVDKKAMSAPTQPFGTQVIFYKEWMCLGITPHFVVRKFPQDSSKHEQVLVGMIPNIADIKDVVDGRIAVIPNPINYVPTPGDIRAINIASNGRLEDIGKSYGLEMSQ